MDWLRLVSELYGWAEDGLQDRLRKAMLSDYGGLARACRHISAQGMEACQNGCLVFYCSFFTAIGFGLYWLAESNAG